MKAAKQMDLIPDTVTPRKARTIVEVVGDALIRKYETWDAAAAALDAVFGPQGRPVSGSVLRAAFSPTSERNYPRLEWIVLVLDDPEVQAALSRKAVTPEEWQRRARDFFAAEAPSLLTKLEKKLGGVP